MYLKFEGEGESKKLSGVAVPQVDDILHLGLYSFDEGVMKPLKEAFYFGSEEEEKFRYMGLNMEQTADGIIVNQDHYVNCLLYTSPSPRDVEESRMPSSA